MNILTDIRIIIGRVFIYIVGLLIVIGFGFIFIDFPLIIPLIVVFSFLVFQLLRKIETSKYLYPKFFRKKSILSTLEKKLLYLLDIETFSKLITSYLRDAFDLDKVGFLTRKGDKFVIQSFQNFNREQIEAFIKDKAFSELKKIKQPQEVKKLDIELYIPLVFEKQIIGIIFLGKNKTSFSKQDIKLLKKFSSKAAIGLRNSLFYSQEKERKQELERFYNLTIGRELKMQELKIKIKALEKKTRELENK